MSKRKKVIYGILFVIVFSLIAFLEIIGLSNIDAYIGLFGVLIGVLLSELSRQQIAKQQRRNELRLAALDKRLESHQEAYTLWRGLLNNLHDPAKLRDVVGDCFSWWEKNCLYLESRSREAFFRAFLTASDYHITKMDQNPDLVKSEYEIIKSAGDVIAKGVELPPVSFGEDHIYKENNDT